MYMKTLAYILAATLVILGSSAYGRNYYVNDTVTNGDVYCTAVGNLSNSGMDPSLPRPGVQSILDDYDLDASDMIWVDTGTYGATNTDGTIFTIGSEDQGSSIDYVTIQGSTNYAAGGTLLNRANTAYNAIVLSSSAYIRVASLTIANARHGIYVEGASNLWIEDVEVAGCAAQGIYLDSAPDAVLKQARIHDNGDSGVSVARASTTLAMEHCTLWQNQTGSSGDKPEISCTNGATRLTLSNCVVYASGSDHYCLEMSGDFGQYFGDYNCLGTNDGAQVARKYAGSVFAHLADWQAFTNQDPHSMALNPQLTTNGNLRSTAGTWVGGTWTTSSNDSPCIDRGDASIDAAAEPAPNAGRINIGAFGGTFRAAKSADSDGDGLYNNQEIFDYGTDPQKTDTDGDGYSDLSEAIAGTEGTNSASFFDFADKHWSSTQQGFVLKWYGSSHRTYQPQWSTNLPAGVWSNCTGLVDAQGRAMQSVSGTNGWETAIDTNGDFSALKYYRIKVAKTP